MESVRWWKRMWYASNYVSGMGAVSSRAVSGVLMRAKEASSGETDESSISGYGGQLERSDPTTDACLVLGDTARLALRRRATWSERCDVS